LLLVCLFRVIVVYLFGVIVVVVLLSVVMFGAAHCPFVTITAVVFVVVAVGLLLLQLLLSFYVSAIKYPYIKQKQMKFIIITNATKQQLNVTQIHFLSKKYLFFLTVKRKRRNVVLTVNANSNMKAVGHLTNNESTKK